MNYKTSLIVLVLCCISYLLSAQIKQPIAFHGFQKLYAAKLTPSEVLLYDSLRLVFEINGVEEEDFLAAERQLQTLINQSSSGKKWIIALYIQPQQQEKLFAQRSVQANFIKFWTNIASAYLDSESITGCQLLVNPSPVKSIFEWQSLAGLCMSAMRKVESEKILFVNYPDGSEVLKNFFSLNDKQMRYVLSTDFLFPTGNQYFKFPEKQKNVVPNDLEFISRSNEAKFPNGFTEFTLISSELTEVNNTDHEMIGLPVFTFSKMNLGKVCVGGFSVTAYDEKGKLIKDIMRTDPVLAGGKWQFDKTTATGTHQVIEKYGVFNNKVMCIDVVEDSASCYNELLYFPVQPKQKISTEAWIQTNYLDYGSSCMMALHFFKSKSKRLVLPFDDSYLAQEIKHIHSFSSDIIFEQGTKHANSLKTKKSQENYINTIHQLLQMNSKAYFRD